MQPISREFLIKQGRCCGCGCKNCPYTPKHVRGAVRVERTSENNR